ncbi:extensin family protein [Rhizobium sp. SSA_523]|uniref:extensin-like domain-containing protein n=1 Tax=Rhizobium sp. SSA_523 TaxID=2952477 RepID=UPI0020910896|nr:extensin family protein [Rhizobium sp. SSA_523]MCO5730049.1 extensin family protein [Rhizobium sp. SSA_523]WKC25116.1 extensin family protein [Rhizobium sp. SSA_523]
MAYAFSARRAIACLMMTTVMTGCTADGLVPPAPVDRGMRVSAIPAQPGNAGLAGNVGGDAGNQSYSANPYPGNSYPANSDPAQAAPGNMPATQQSMAMTRRLPMIDSDEALGLSPQDAPAQTRVLGAPPSALGTLTYSANGVNIDSELGIDEEAAAPVVGLAEEQDAAIAEGRVSQPVVDGIGTDNPVALGGQAGARAGQQMSGAGPAQGLEPISAPVAPMPPQGKRLAQDRRAEPGMAARWDDQSRVTPPSRPEPEPQQVAMLMPNKPGAAPMSPRMNEPMPASEAACRRELKRLGVQFTDKPPINDGPSCGIDFPVSLSGLSGNISVKPAVTLNCQTTLAFAKWVKNELAPSARIRYLTGIRSIRPMGGYSCRRMNNSRQKYNPMSEHARGNAIDIGRFTLKDGHEIDIRKKGFFSFREGGLLKAVRSDSCKYFNTVLGPGSNAEHWNHFHFDLRRRASGNRYCS